MKRKGSRAILLMLAAGLALGLAAHPAGAQDAQGLAEAGQLGGAARALAALPEGGLLLGEGEAIVRLDAAGRVRRRAEPGRGEVLALAVRGQLAYALTARGVTVLELPALAEIAFRPGGGQALLVSDRAVYVAARQAGLRVGTLDRRGLPAAWQVVSTPAAALDLALDAAGETLYVALGESGIGVFDVTGAGVPEPAVVVSASGPVETLRVSGDRLLAGSGHRLLVYDLAAPLAPRLLDAYSPLNDAADVLLRQSGAYVADRAGGLRRFSLAALDDPRPEGDVLWPGAVHALAADARYLFAAAGRDGVIVFDAGLPDGATLHRQLPLPGEAIAIAIGEEGGRLALVGLAADGAAVIDWRAIDAPEIKAVLATESPVRAVALRDRLAFVGLESGAVHVYSLADLDVPRRVATLALGGPALDFALDGTLLYVAAAESGLVIVETRRPAEPEVRGLLAPQAGQAFLGVALEGGKRAYLSAGNALVIADVDDPAAPEVLASVAVPAQAAVARDFIVYAAGGPAFSTVNAASSNLPRVLGAYRALAHVRTIAAFGDRVWLAGDGDDGRLLRLELAGDGRAQEAAFAALAGGGIRALALSTEGTLLIGREDGAILRGDGALVRSGLAVGDVLLAADGDQLFAAGQGWAEVALEGAGPRIVAAGDSGGWALDAARGLDRVFLALGDQGVRAIGREGETLGTWLPEAHGGSARGVAALEGAVLVAEAGPGAQGALNVLAAEPLATIARVALPGPAQAVAAADGLAFVAHADGDSGALSVIDVRTPTAGWVRVGGLDSPAAGLAVMPGQTRGFAAQGDALTALDLAAWPQIVPRGTVTLPLPVTDLVQLGGRYLAGVAPQEAVLILDVVTGPLPQVVAALPLGAQVAAGDGSTLYLGSLARGLEAVALGGDWDGAVRAVGSQPVSALWLADGRLYAAGPGELRVYAVRGSNAPVPVGAVALGMGEVAGLSGLETRRGERWLYFVQDGALWVVVDLPGSGLGTPVRLAEDAARLVGVNEGGLVYTGRDGALRVAALDGPAALAWTVALPLPGGRVRAALAWEDRALVATAGGIVALNRLPGGAPPTAVGRLAGLAGVPRAILPGADGTLWLAGAGHVWRVDARDPARPVVMSSAPVPGEVGGMARLPDGRLAVSAGPCGVRVLDAASLWESGYWRAGRAADVAATVDGVAVVGDGRLTLLRIGSGGTPETPAEPSDPRPADHADRTGTALTLGWGAEDDPCDPVHYQVWMGAEGGVLALAGETGEPRFEVIGLLDSTPIVWQVRAIDRQGDARAGPLWHFNTGTAVSDGVRLAARLAPLTPTPAATPAGSALTMERGGEVEPRSLLGLVAGGLFLEAVLVGWLYLRWRRWRRG